MDQDDQDDAEKRIADLERQLADQERGADLPPGQPPQQANAAPETGSGTGNAARVGTRAWIVWVFAIFCVVSGLYFLPAAVSSVGTARIVMTSGCFVAIATGVVVWWWVRRKYKSR
jgi:hypothetical protein